MNAACTDPRAPVWRFLADRIERRVASALLFVVDCGGHSPGKTGFAMAVGADSGLAGTIGGGAVEHDLVEEARAALDGPRPLARLTRKVHREVDPDTSGMICGGFQVVATVSCRDADAPALRRLVAALDRGSGGRLELSPAGIAFTPNRHAAPAAELVRQGRRWTYAEQIPPPERLFIIGGGHVGLATARVMATLGFRITVIDERPDVATLIENTWAHERRVMPFSDVGRAVPGGPRTWALIMTPSHRADELVLRQLVRKRLRFLGVMASSRKAQKVFDSLQASGVPASALARVRMPVGLKIASHTAAEIAVSIAAEIIQVRNAAPPAVIPGKP